MSLNSRIISYVKKQQTIQVKTEEPIFEEVVIEKKIPMTKIFKDKKGNIKEKTEYITKKIKEKNIIGYKEIIEDKIITVNDRISVINHENVEFNKKKYIVCYCSYNNDDILFVIDDNDNKDNILPKKWHYVNDNYIGNTYYDSNKIKKELYLHNFVMNKIGFYGKSQETTVDHINRIGRDNRLENLRELSQSHQNINQSKRERTTELPPGCGIDPQDLPKNIYYKKPEGLHGDRFYLEIKFTDPPFRYFSSSSKKIDLKTKLQQTLLKLEEYKKEHPEYVELLDDINNVKQRNDLRKSFNEIIKLSGYPQDIIEKNLVELEEEKQNTIDDTSKDIAQQLVTDGIKSLTSNLPPNCGVTQEMIPKYCYYKPASDKRGDKFIIERHPVLVAQGKRQWATTEAKTKTTKEKFDLMIEKLKELTTV
jgi:hypothetical protein